MSSRRKRFSAWIRWRRPIGFGYGLEYGTGLRLLGIPAPLRIKDLDGGNNVIVVRHGKGGKDRRTMFPEAVKPGLREHVRRVLAVHSRDVARGTGTSPLPDAFAQIASSLRDLPGSSCCPACYNL